MRAEAGEEAPSSPAPPGGIRLDTHEIVALLRRRINTPLGSLVYPFSSRSSLYLLLPSFSRPHFLQSLPRCRLSYYIFAVNATATLVSLGSSQLHEINCVPQRLQAGPDLRRQFTLLELVRLVDLKRHLAGRGKRATPFF